MEKPRRYTRSIALAAVLTTGAAPAPATALEPIKIAIVTSLASAPIFIAEAKGYFRDEGLAPELVRFDSAAPIAVAVAAGDIDFGSAGLNAAFFTLAHQGILKIIGSGNSEYKGFQGLGYVVSNQASAAGVQRFEDLKGRSVAITQTGTRSITRSISSCRSTASPSPMSACCRCNPIRISPRRSPAARPMRRSSARRTSTRWSTRAMRACSRGIRAS